MGTKLKNEESKSFEDSLNELEQILKELEGSQIPLEDLVSKYERAKKCLDECRTKLDSAEMKIKKLGKNGAEDFEAKVE